MRTVIPSERGAVVSLFEVYKFLVELLREGIGAAVAFALGLAVGGWLVGWAIYRRVRNQDRIARDHLRAENQVAQDEQDRQRRRADARTDELHELQSKVARERAHVGRQWQDYQAQFRARLRATEARATAYHGELERLRAAEADLSRRLDDLTDQCAEAEARDRAVQDELAQLRDFSERMDAVVRDLGNLWLRAVPADAPAFRPVRERRPPIIALLNFKGGVGKTTLTANLAATFAGQGERVLMIDLDYQGSLTSLVLPNADLRVAAAESRLAQDLFVAGDCREELRSYVHPLADLTDTLALLPATDPLADVETWLLARWLIQPQLGDVRFTLRGALHNPSEVGDFDRILIDCPPRLTAACVNALACCDYVLVPVNLDRTATLAAPRLLGLLRRLQPVLMPGLGGVGLVANRSGQKTLAADEQDLWDTLADQCRDAWGRPVELCPTVVPQRAAFRRAANRNRLAINDDAEVRATFVQLASDLNERMPRESRRTTPVLR